MNRSKIAQLSMAALLCAFLIAGQAPVFAVATQDIVGTAVDAGAFTTLVTAIEAAGLVETLKGDGPFTVFAPTDDAFAALPEGTLEDLLMPENLATLQGILTYHVVPGKVMAADVVNLDMAETVNGASVMIKVMDGQVMVDGANVIQTDIEATNGVIHVLDAVIMPPAPSMDIVATAIDAGAFTTLVAAIEAAGLVETLQGDGPFTVFAPTDEAFAALPEGTLEDLLMPENLATLQGILTYHVVPGKVMAADVVNLDMAETVNGQPVMIEVVDGKVMVDNATVTQTDIEASNGVIHVIDTVIIPAPAAAVKPAGKLTVMWGSLKQR